MTLISVGVHGGRITVESELGAGSHFVIELPEVVETAIGASAQDPHATDAN